MYRIESGDSHPMFFTAKRALIEHGRILEAKETTT